MPLTVKTPVYEGPLDLLLELIEKRKLLINDISLAAVADEYIAQVNAMETLPVGETAQFISLAATLLLIKSRSLLPNLELSQDEERDIKELQYRLAVYQLLKDAARGLKAALGGAMLYEGIPQSPEPMFLPDNAVTQESLRAAAQALIQGFPQMAVLPKVEVKKIMSLEEMIGDLSRRINSAMRLSFREFTGKKEKGEVIVGFLALLELVKQGIIKASQEKDFGDIQLQSDKVSTPSYE
jgi:segregation and condensation protein A